MDNPVLLYSLFALAGFLAGSIPFGLVLSYLGGYGDIRKIGSGNIGATNVLRTGNKLLALATLLLDSGKGALIVLGMSLISNTIELKLVCGLGAILGHCYSPWLGFKGGKGVATTLGTLLAAAPFAGLAACFMWSLTALISRISSLSALIAILATIPASYYFYGSHASWLCFLMTTLVFIRHHANIERIFKGTEPRIGANKREEPVSQSPPEPGA